MKKVLAMTAAAGMLFTAAACSTGGTTESGQQSGSAKPADSGKSASAAPQKTADPASKKTFDISFMNFAFTIFPPPQSKGVDKIKEKFNANIKSEFILDADYKSKLSVVMASGNMPDVVAFQGPDSNYYKWAKQGAFLPLNDYISKYETFKIVPDSIYNQIKVNGNIYSIPIYSPTYTFSGLIRQDWLDNLGLSMPTNYEELLKVAVAFTKNDPDRNGKDDTYGFALSQNINPDFNMGAYWSAAWYHKDAEGQYIPGVISQGRKTVIETLAAAYAQGAVTKDFAALNWAQTNKEFYSGKAGIFIGTPTGMVEDYYLGLLKVSPEAKLAPIPFFVSPDGRQGGQKGSGHYGLMTLPARLKSEPDKVAKILEIMDYGRKFIPISERNPKNERYDWLMGGEGVGYEMVDGLPMQKEGWETAAPLQYMLQRHEYWKPWAPSNEANEFSKTYKSQEMQKLIASIEEMEKKYNKEPFDDPSFGIYSEAKAQKGAELDKYILGEQTKMIAGQRPLSDWDKMVKEYMDRGGADIVKEVNAGIKERDGK